MLGIVALESIPGGVHFETIDFKDGTSTGLPFVVAHVSGVPDKQFQPGRHTIHCLNHLNQPKYMMRGQLARMISPERYEEMKLALIE